MFRIELSNSNSPLVNLQKEHSLLTGSEQILFLYQNTPSVILGKHQCIRSEVNLDFCAQHHIEIFRRISGGGAVYHDMGNINWAFISDKTETPLLDTNPCLPIVRFLESLQIRAQIGCRNELTVDGYKISGTASKIVKKRQLFHGTLLYNSNLHHLSHALQGNQETRGRAIASVPSQVVNLSSLLVSPLTTEEFIDRMVHFFHHYE